MCRGFDVSCKRLWTCLTGSGVMVKRQSGKNVTMFMDFDPLIFVYTNLTEYQDVRNVLLTTNETKTTSGSFVY